MGMEPRYGTCHAAAMSRAPEESEQNTWESDARQEKGASMRRALRRLTSVCASSVLRSGTW